MNRNLVNHYIDLRIILSIWSPGKWLDFYHPHHYFTDDINIVLLEYTVIRIHRIRPMCRTKTNKH